MRTIYIDKDFKCHPANDGTMTPVQTDFFDGKCDAFVEGYILKPEGKDWTRSDGTVFSGTEMITPWKDFRELEEAQSAYEAEVLEDAENALAILLGGAT